MWTFVRRKPLGAAGRAAARRHARAGLLADGVAPYGYDEADIFARLKAAERGHWLGTDNLGRDLLSRVIYGARVSMAVGFGGVALGLARRTAVGLVSGYFGGRLDLVLQRLVDAFMCFPLLLVALTIMALLGPGLGNVILTLGLVLGVRDSRVIRSAVLTVKAHLYLEAARALGAAHAGMIWPPRPAEHPRADHHPGHRQPGRGHPHRGGAVLPGLRRAAAAAVVGRHALRRRAWSTCSARPGSPSGPASRCRSRCSAPTCWATRCGTCSTRACAAAARPVGSLTLSVARAVTGSPPLLGWRAPSNADEFRKPFRTVSYSAVTRDVLVVSRGIALLGLG